MRRTARRELARVGPGVEIRIPQPGEAMYEARRMPRQGIENEPTRHAFVIVGHETLFIVHLTMMVMEEHSYQLVLEASLPRSSADLLAEDRSRHPDETYFIANRGDDLMTVPEIGAGRRTGFSGTIWRGIPKQHEYTSWPWKDWAPFLDRVELGITRAVLYRHFDLAERDPGDLTYHLFGKGREAHLHNHQIQKPAFDHVVSLDGAPAWVPPHQLEAGFHVNIPELDARPPDDPSVYCSDPLTDSAYEVTYCGDDGQRYPIEIGKRHWFSTAVVNGANPCPKS